MGIRMKPKDRDALWNDMELLQCNYCGGIRGVGGFNKDTGGQYGYDNACKVCRGVQVRKSMRKRLKTDPFFKFKHDLRLAVLHSFKRKNWNKPNKTIEIIGCSFETAQAHLEATCQANYGCSIEELGGHHIDHIKPIATATTEEEVVALCYYTNLQILTPEDNLAKGAKYD